MGMKRLLILSVFLIGGLFQVPASAMSFHEKECKEVFDYGWNGNLPRCEQSGGSCGSWDVECWDYISEDGKRWIGSSKSSTSD